MDECMLAPQLLTGCCLPSYSDASQESLSIALIPKQIETSLPY